MIIVANWKMNAPDPTRFAAGLADVPEGVQCVICAPFHIIWLLTTVFERTARVLYGAQDISAHENGAYTGEISAEMLDLMDVGFALVGHSERRRYHGETDELINLKARAALKREIVPILCVGETLEEREAGRTEEILTRQVRGGRRAIADPAALIVAYEPVWAIGTGRSATPEDAESAASHISRLVPNARVLYGGSVTAANAEALLSQPHIGGALVGGASLDARELSNIIKIAGTVNNRKANL
ncbi:MAG: triose-phosphate isomerase [Oscillospiraceae bacterium]|jgi:triosephosphate isomerase|nr:triose-phosphate isomerase [Oscillospiraceae bacterium]